MPDNEKFEYSYDLDISSLQQGTSKAINLLQQQIDALTGVTRKTKSAATSAKTFERAWLNASNKIAGSQAKMVAAMEKAQRAADKYLAQESAQKASIPYEPTKMQAQIEALVGIGEKAKSAAASARIFEKAWLDASDKVVSKAPKTQKSLEEVANAVPKGATIAQSAFGRLSQIIGGLKGPVQQAFNPITEKLSIMSKWLDMISLQKFRSFKDKAQSALNRVSSVLNQVASAFRRTSQDTDTDAKSTKTLVEYFNKLNTATKKLSSGLKKTSSGVKSVGDFFKKCSTTLKNFNSSLQRTGIVAQVASSALKQFTAFKLGEYLAEGIKQSISYVENLNLFTVAMGDAIEEGNKFVDTMQELYGMDPSNIMRYAGNFFQLATAIEMPDAAATKLSLTMTKAVNDISSLFNVDIETVFTNMSAGLQGMSRAVRKYGMDIRATTLQTEALALGITEQVENMSEANRIGLRFIAMMKQAANASGDFAANIETPANQLRIFKEQVAQLGRAIGDFFIAPLRNALQYVNGFIMALRAVLVFIRKLLGIEVDFQTRTTGLSSGLDDAASSLGGVGDSAADATKKLKGMLAPFDELNVLARETPSESAGIGAGFGGSDIMDPRIAKAIEDMEYKFEEIEMKANKVRNAILDFFGFEVDAGEIIKWNPAKFEQNLINKFPQWTNTIQAAFDNWSTIVENFKRVVASIGDVFAEAWKKYKSTLAKIFTDEKVAAFINDLTDDLGNFADWISANQGTLSSLGEALMWVVTALIALKAAAPVFNLVAKGFSAISKVAGVISAGISGASAAFGVLSKVLSALTSPIGLITAGIVLLAAVSEDFRNALGNLFGALWDTVQPILESLMEILSTIISELGPPILDMIKSIGDALAPIIDLVAEIIEMLVPLITGVISLLTGIISAFVQSLSGVFQGIADFIGGIAQIVRGVVEIISGILTGDFKKIGHGLLNIFAGVLNAISGLVETIVNAIITVVNTAISFLWRLLADFVNGIISGINGVLSWLGVGTISWSMSVAGPQIPKLSIPKVTVPAFEDGGIVPNGQLFIANESGPEYVGAMGNHTAVANNEQIIAGITQGVVDGIIQTGILSYVRSIDQSARVTADKDFTLGKPSASAGRWIKQSSDAYDKVRG